MQVERGMRFPTREVHQALIWVALTFLFVIFTASPVLSQEAIHLHEGAQTSVSLWIAEHNEASRRLFAGGSGSLQHQFGSTHPDLTLNVLWLNWDELLGLLKEGAALGVVPDVVQVPAEYLPYLAEEGLLAPLDTFVKGWAPFDDYFQVAKDAVVWKENVYGLPAYVAPHAMVYSTVPMIAALIDQQPLPDTWDDYREFLQRIASYRRQAVKYRPTDNRWHLDWSPFLSLLWQAGGELTDETGRATFNDEAGVRALSFLHEIHELVQELDPPADRGLGPPISLGQVASVYADPSLLALVEAVDSTRLGTLLVGPPLKGERRLTLVETDVYAVPHGAPNPEVAWKLLQFLTEPDVASAYARAIGYLPADRRALKHWAALAFDPRKERFVQAAEEWGRAVPAFPKQSLLKAFLTTAIFEGATGVKAPQEALDQAAARWDRAMGLEPVP